MRKRLLPALAVLPLVLLAGCSKTENNAAAPAAQSGGGAGSYGYKIAVVTHGAAGDTFWSVVKAGAEKAGKDMGDQVSYQSDGDPQKQSQLIDAAVNQKVDGLVVSMANPDALKSSIQKAVAAGIPVVTINSGQAQSAAFGALSHVGQDETIAGQGAGQKLKGEGVSKLLCVVHEAGNVGLEQRCSGAKTGLGGTVENLQVDGNDLQAAQATIKSKLQADKSINGVLTLNPGVAAVAVTAVTDSGSSAKLATFDVNADVISAIEGGKITFAVDQQQYEQGYLPVVMLTLYKANLNTLGGGQPVLTGPGFITKDNAAKIADLAKAGTR
ncbi:MAG TPA: sugar ABC transporter substrate-binding protein [Mycobacteriales bacterium]|nr:sugar ABC transporter substrate-binding protein [Mycobacteriales bacterium]